MVIGEQLNQQQAPQQIAASHRLPSNSVAAATISHHRRNSSNSFINQQNQVHQQQQQQVGTISAALSGLNGNHPGQNSHSGSSNNINNLNNINSNVNNANNVSGLVGGGTSVAAAKNQLEQLNTMREALFSQDGWGCQHVNQDTNWEVPSSPEPSNKDPSSGPAIWKPNINNGTDLWESNLRNGGQPPPQPVQKTPWGHTPSSNLGGTWGEDDDGSDSSNVWTGTSNNAGPTSVSVVGVTGVSSATVGGGSQWGQNSVTSGGNPSVGVTGTIGNIVGTAAAVNTVVGGVGVLPVASSSTGSSINTGGNGWGDPRDLRGGPMLPIDIRNVDPRDTMRAASSGDPRDLRMIDPRDPIRGDPRGISGRLNGTSEMWGQHHSVAHGQISLNKMVGAGNAPTNVTVLPVAGGIGTGVGGIVAANSVGGNTTNSQWGATQSVVGPKDIAPMANKQSSGWEEPSPPPQRRNMPNYDDGTSLWGQQSRLPGGGSHWKEMSDQINRSHLLRSAIGSQNATNTGVGGINSGGAGGLGASTAVGVQGNTNNPIGGVNQQGRLGVGSAGPTVSGQLKPDNTMWGVHSGASSGSARNVGTWGDDGSHNVITSSGGNWSDDKSASNIGQLGSSVSVGGGNSWTDSSAVPTWNKNTSKVSGGGWNAINNDTNDLPNEWTHTGIVSKSQQKLGGVGIGSMSSEMIKNSKQYRVLIDNGYKKEDVERALINANMNIEEAAEMLRTNANMTIDSWRRHEEALGSYGDHSNATGSFQSRYTSAGSQPTTPFPSTNNILNNMNNTVGGGGNNSGLSTLNTMQPLHVQKYITQGPHNVAGGQPPVNTFSQGVNIAAVSANATSSNSSQPSAQQLRMLVQQIQLAVHSGYLSSQILNQPLAPATLLLLNQLLSNIKHLQAAQQSLTRGNNATNLQINVAIAKYKQQIQNLQNQINAQQAMYIKQQSLQQNTQQVNVSSHVTNTNAEYLRGQHDAINAMQGNFAEINLNKPSGYQGNSNQQSRLNQWKLPVLEKDVNSDSADFSRAPGATKQNLSSTNTNSMGPLSIQGEGTWSTGRNISDGWPDQSNDHESKDWSVAQTSAATPYTDLVQEFEPGKPWKGSQIKSIEDDPSITPGSVARSPLSINPTPKEADIFANSSKTSPTDLPPLGLSSSTWSFNPSSNQNFPSWSDNPQQCSTSELWSTPINKSSRGPPPGLGSNKSGVVSISGVSVVTNASSVATGSSNGWMVGGRCHNITSSWTSNNSNWNSNWLLLKNLTAQIDGSTLRTLCMQHGPLISFHLYLNQGIALCKYATREEANKAQMTLNNCVLGNTTICAESPNENEVQNILHHLPQTSNQLGSSGNGNNAVNSSGNNANANSVGNISSVNGGGTNSSNNNAGGINSNVVNNVGSGLINNVSSNSGNCNTPVIGSNNTGGQNQTISVGNAINNNSSTAISSNAVGNGGAGSSSNSGTVGVNNAVWRQTQNQHLHQNLPSRHAGRETDFDYISKYVCSIVDD